MELKRIDERVREKKAEVAETLRYDVRALCRRQLCLLVHQVFGMSSWLLQQIPASDLFALGRGLSQSETRKGGVLGWASWGMWRITLCPCRGRGLLRTRNAEGSRTCENRSACLPWQRTDTAPPCLGRRTILLCSREYGVRD